MKTKISIFFTALLLSLTAQAQTVKWCIHPEYDDITYFGEDLFKCVDHSGKVQLVDWDGKELLHVDADAVTDFAEGYAVVLKGNKILGILAQARGHNFQTVTGDYSMTQYPFFSEGLLAVADSKGKMGYMDVKGNIAIPCKYEEARPFKQGWASVEIEKKKVYYINPQGRTRNPEGFHGGKLTKGSSFNENKQAVVANYQDYAVIGTNMQVIEKINYTSDLPVRVCDYAYSKEAKPCQEASNYEKVADDRIETYSGNGGYGYQWKNGDDKYRLPAQFREAQPFYNGRAIVVKNGKCGVLELLEGKFVANWPNDLRVYPDGKSNLLRFSLEVPSTLDSDQISLEFDEGDGNYQKNTQLIYEFRPSCSRGSEFCTLRGKAIYDGLLLWEDDEDITINRIAVDIKRPAVTTEFADENDMQTVKTIITNTSKVSVSVDATLKAAGLTDSFNGTLKPKQSQSLTITVKVTESKQVPASVSVTVDGRYNESQTSQVSLKI